MSKFNEFFNRLYMMQERLKELAGLKKDNGSSKKQS